MRLDEDEIGRLTLSLFDALCDRALDERRARRLAAGEIAAAVYNVHRDPEKVPEPITALDFVPDLKRELEEKKKREIQSPDEMLAILEQIFGCGPNKGPVGRVING